MNVAPLLDWLKERAGEKSTWVGILSMAASVFGHAVTPDQAPLIDSAAAVITGVVLILTREEKK